MNKNNMSVLLKKWVTEKSILKLRCVNRYFLKDSTDFVKLRTMSCLTSIEVLSEGKEWVRSAKNPRVSAAEIWWGKGNRAIHSAISGLFLALCSNVSSGTA